jgi:CDP-diacylglycerol--serine O-phosphatidyltransferase
MKRRQRKARSRAVDSRKRGYYIFPNLLTTAGLFCGFYSLVASFQQDFEKAALAIVAAFAFDGLDGRVARVTHTTSAFGVEYDSLSDLVAFGVAPAFLCLTWGLGDTGRLGWLAAFLFTACGALRLARFNVQAGKTRLTSFRGLPIPAAAGLLATLAMLSIHMGWTRFPSAGVVLGLLYVLSFLMVSNIPYRSFKDLAFFRQKPFQTMVGSVLLLVVILIHPPITLFAMAAAYAASGPIELVMGLRKAPLPEEETGHLYE